MKHGLIYLASPYSHPDTTVVNYRFQVVCRAAGRLMGEGHLIFSPIAHTHPIAMTSNLPTHWEFWERMDKAHLDRAAELWVLCMDGWKESKGIKAEILYAEKIGLPIRAIRPTAHDLMVMPGEVEAMTDER